MALRTFDLSYRQISEALWARVFEHSASLLRAQGDELFRQLTGLEQLRAKAQHDTGSISLSTQWALFALTCYLCPSVVAEIGTFIGKSTIAMARGMDAAGHPGEIHTCDAANHMELPKLSKTAVTQYPGSGSTQMLQEMVEDGYAGRVDLVHLDGRLMKDDRGLIAQLCAQRAVIVLDDFEGVEKGVLNLMALRNAEPWSQWQVAYPPPRELLQRFGLTDPCTTGLLFPGSSLALVAQ